MQDTNLTHLPQFLHYSTQPFDADAHAMRRSGRAGVIWGQAVTYYSAALIAFGVAIKVLLKYHKYSALPAKYAWLACGSLALCYVLVQFMKVLHGGVDQWMSDVGLFDSLPRCLFDPSVPHTSAGKKSARDFARETAADGVSVQRRQAIFCSKVSLLALMVVLPAVQWRTWVLAVVIALWCAAVVVVEAVNRSALMGIDTAHGEHGSDCAIAIGVCDSGGDGDAADDDGLASQQRLAAVSDVEEKKEEEEDAEEEGVTATAAPVAQAAASSPAAPVSSADLEAQLEDAVHNASANHNSKQRQRQFADSADAHFGRSFRLG
jgi:hypothetical protein